MPRDEADLLSILKHNIKNRIKFDEGHVLRPGFDISLDGCVNDFLRDFTALLNTFGGHLLYGVESKENVIGKILGLQIKNPENFKLSLRQIIEENIEPKVSPALYRIELIKVDEGSYLLYVKVKQSDISPHAILFDNGGLSFYKRKDGNCPLGVNDLRNEFLVKGLPNIRAYKEMRAKTIENNISYVPLMETGKLILHIIPRNAFFSEREFDIETVSNNIDGFPWANEGMQIFEGYLSYFSDYSYVMIDQNLIMEAVDAFNLKPRRDHGKRINLVNYQKDLASLMEAYLQLLKELKVDFLELYASISLVNINDYKMKLKSPKKQKMIDTDVIFLPERLVNIENIKDRDDILRIVNDFIDILWNSSGSIE